MSTIYLPSRDLPEGYGAFDQDEEEKDICAICEEETATIKVIRSLSYYISGNRTELVCIDCFADPDYQELIDRRKYKIVIL